MTLKDQIALLEAEVARLNNGNREDFEREQGGSINSCPSY